MKKFSRALAWLLAIVMIVGMLPAAFAADEAEPIEVLNADEAIDPTIPIFENPQYSFAERAADLVARMTLTQKAAQITSQNAPAISAGQLGVGALSVPATKGIGGYTWWSETLHGCRGGVNYPQNTTVASTWNPDLYYQEATNIGQEIREQNMSNLNFYSPTINMHRDPRWGRNEESYSEDVYLTAKMGTAWVQGLEGKDREGNVLDPDGYLMAHSTIKHYVANNNEGSSSGDTTGRLRAGAISSLRMLREYYALPYGEIIRGADVSSVMTAYSYYGVAQGKFDPSSYSSYLMDTLLRQVYGFSGYITGDCDSVNSMQNLHYTNYYTGKEITAPEAFAGALAHGEDLECNGGHSSPGSGTSGFKTTYGSQMNAMLGQETDKGTFTENTVDIALHRLMTARIQTGDLDGNIKIKQDASQRNRIQLQTSVRRPLVEQINREGVVMLQNKDNILPLDLSADGISKVAIVGSWQTNGSTGLYAQASGNQQNIQAGIQAAFNAKKSGISYTLITSNSLSDANKTAIAEADVAIVVTGTSSGYSQEDHDRTTTALPDNQETLINNVAAANPNTIVIMETCGPMRVNRFQNNVKAILWSSFGGQWKNGFGDIMAGYCPSGKLTDTWYNEVNDSGESDIPRITDYDLVPSEGKNGRTYMYYNGASKPSYPFGYGLSYTTFEYSDLTIDKTAYDANDTVKVTFKVKNTGAVAGKETTQLYVAQPDAPAELKRPIRRLEGFEKVDLEPGETKTISMEVKIEDLAFFDEAADCFLVDTGRYQVQVGTNSAEANLTKDFTVSGTLTETPAVVTMKANQAGDKALGVEQRLIFDKSKEVDPQLTVSMNNEKLYGYIIAQQHSNIKSEQSCPLPEGMTVTYSSNRESVVKVVDGKVYTAGPGVATLTATVTYNGVTATGDTVIYVMANSNIDDITVDGQTVAKFSPTKYKYSMTLENKSHIPVVAGTTSNPDLEVVVEQATELPGVATIRTMDKDTGVGATYTITFKVKPSSGGGSTAIDFGSVADSGKYEISGQTDSEVEEGVGLALVSTQGGVEPAKQSIAEQDLDVVKIPVAGDWTATLETEFDSNGARNGYYQFFGFYASEGGDNQNMVGIRGGDGAIQDFIRKDGAITEETMSSSPGFDTTGKIYYLRIEKEGDTYTCYRSDDGEDWAEMFVFEGCGIEADQIVIDAYTGMTEGYKFTLKSLFIDGVGGGGLPSIDFTTVADSDKYEISGQTESEIDEGVGLALIATQGGVEPAKQSIAEQDIDVVKVPVAGDWTATLETDFDTNGAANGYYQFFGFYASEGGDNQNMVGIRGGDGAMQDFIR
ncbi:MAG: glycoside hydrolase family 3 C-terminal domain-containing protein, partial [Oscillospiraceae bacterium]|nr:glycoside hydrolase family 3 C-terminal domain-containing protein [Oscillospiraceae bacterium]